MKTSTYKSSILISSTVALPLLLAMPVAHADFGLTLGADNQSQRYDNTKNDATALLGVEYRGKNFNIDRKGISYDLTDSENFTKKYAIEAILKSKNRGYEADDGRTFTGMDDRDDSVDIGARAVAKTNYGPVILEMTRDLNASKGYEADLRLGGIAPHTAHWTGKRDLSFAPLVGVKYQSDKVVDYHYGVRSSEATASRAAYSSKAATTPYIGIESQFNITKHVSMNAGAIYERRDDAIRNSPLTSNKKSDVLLNLGVTYWF